MTRRRPWLAVLIVIGVADGLLLLGAPGARASGVLGSGVGPDIGPNLNPLPSISELLDGIVNGLFGALLSALTPSFLKHADIHTLEWLVAFPNVADASVWPTAGHLQQNMVWVAGAMLPTTLVIAATRDTALSLSFRAHPGNALLRVVGAVFCLVLYRFGVQTGVAFVNVLTHTMLAWPIVAQGLHRTVLVMFGGSVIFGAGGAFLGLLGLVALVFAVCLFVLKVLLLMILAVLFVSGPLLIALAPLPTIGHLAQGWLLALVGVCLIPVGWCIIFATAGAISLDVTNIGGGAHIGSRVVGAFAALVTFYIAFKWPLMVLGHVRGSLGALGVRPGAASGSATVSSDRLAIKAQRARSRLQAAMLAGGRGVGLAAGALGAPGGGLAGLAARQARPHLASAAASGAIAVGAPRARPRQTSRGGRLVRAGDAIRDTPRRMREAWRAAGEPADASVRGANSGPNEPIGFGADPSRGSRRAPGAPSRKRSGGRTAEGSTPASSALSANGPRRRDQARAPVMPQAHPRPGEPKTPVPGRGDGLASAHEQMSAPAQAHLDEARSPRPRSVQARSSAEWPPGPARSEEGSPRSKRPVRRPRPSAPRQPRPRKGKSA